MNDLLRQLPEYEPHPDLWARIETDLDSDAVLARAIGELPDGEPKAALWADIEATLSDGAATDVPVGVSPITQPDYVFPFTIARPLWAGLAAAAVVVLVGTWLFMRSSSTETVRVEYAVETSRSLPGSTAVLTDIGPTDADQRAEAFIRQQCAEQTLACQRPEVHELRNQLTDLTAEQKRIEQERQTFGDDPRLVRAQVQIENQRADVTKELITLLRS